MKKICQNSVNDPDRKRIQQLFNLEVKIFKTMTLRMRGLQGNVCQAAKLQNIIRNFAFCSASF